MNRLILFIILFPILSSLSAQKEFSKDVLIEDFREYIFFLEETHTDPYYPFGGKIQFQEEVQNLINDIPKKGLNEDDFRKILTTFNSKLRDGHTFIINEQPIEPSAIKKLNLEFKILSDGIVISRSPNMKVNGMKVVAINEVPIEELLIKIQSIEICENIAGAYLSLVNTLQFRSSVNKLFDHIDADSIMLSLIDNQSKIITETINYVSRENFDAMPNPKSIDIDISRTKPFEYKYIDNDKKIVWFAYNSTYSREVIEFQKKLGQDYKNNLNLLYNIFNLDEVPVDYYEAIKKIPSLTEAFFEMLESMKKNKSTHLIIDLRENGGGWNPINIPTLYMMKGDEYFAYQHKAKYITRLSSQFLQKINTDIEDYNTQNNSKYKVGDYSFSYFSK